MSTHEFTGRVTKISGSTGDSRAMVEIESTTADALALHAGGSVTVSLNAEPPKPAWHDAVAVIASTRFTERQVWERYTGEWCGTAGDEVCADDLTDVTPLIEQKVTDEMVDRIEHHFVATQQASLPVGFAEKILNIALGLDPA